MKLHPARRPKGRRWFYCRLCDIEFLRAEKSDHEETELHSRLAAQFSRDEFLDSIEHHECERVWFQGPSAARLSNLLWDANEVLVRMRRFV